MGRLPTKVNGERQSMVQRTLVARKTQVRSSLKVTPS